MRLSIFAVSFFGFVEFFAMRLHNIEYFTECIVIELFLFDKSNEKQRLLPILPKNDKCYF